ncbi:MULTISPECIES: hypothetical protein [unclassified Roseitalea]|uniref:hypothetical protein n=1 Tax=unclassified Roseitalea TaxID=2639107 RepID=UPI00273F96CE|nr:MULTISPECIES: hypothetical protein [unclassified Roseitalea]
MRRFDPVRSFVHAIDRSEPGQADRLRRLMLKCMPRYAGGVAICAAADEVQDLLVSLRQAYRSGADPLRIKVLRRQMLQAVDELEALCENVPRRPQGRV